MRSLRDTLTALRREGLEHGPLTVKALRIHLDRFPDDAEIVEHDADGNYRVVYADPGQLSEFAIVDGNKNGDKVRVSIANLAT